MQKLNRKHQNLSTSNSYMAVIMTNMPLKEDAVKIKNIVSEYSKTLMTLNSVNVISLIYIWSYLLVFLFTSIN